MYLHGQSDQSLYFLPITSNLQVAHLADRPALHARRIEHIIVPNTRTVYEEDQPSGQAIEFEVDHYQVLPLRRGIRSDKETATQEQRAEVIAPIRFIANCIVAGTNTHSLRELEERDQRRLTVEANAFVNVKIEITYCFFICQWAPEIRGSLGAPI